jgi:hypothetical protein
MANKYDYVEGANFVKEFKKMFELAGEKRELVYDYFGAKHIIELDPQNNRFALTNESTKVGLVAFITSGLLGDKVVFRDVRPGQWISKEDEVTKYKKMALPQSFDEVLYSLITSKLLEQLLSGESQIVEQEGAVDGVVQEVLSSNGAGFFTIETRDGRLISTEIPDGVNSFMGHKFADLMGLMFEESARTQPLSFDDFLVEMGKANPRALEAFQAMQRITEHKS